MEQQTPHALNDDGHHYWITAVIAITSIGQGVQKATEQQLQGLGANLLQGAGGGCQNRKRQPGWWLCLNFNLEDAKAMQSQVSTAQLVSAYLQQNAQVVYDQENTSTTIVGTDINYPDVRKHTPSNRTIFHSSRSGCR